MYIYTFDLDVLTLITSASCFASGVDHALASLEARLNPYLANLCAIGRGPACLTAVLSRLREWALISRTESEVP